MKIQFHIFLCFALLFNISFSQETINSALDFVPNQGQITDFNNKPRPWDGKHLGIDVKDDVYIWKVRYKNLNGLDVYEKSGHLTLTRPEK
ncbi:hypothetical protein N9544_01870 [Flavobacteriales bacterium]|nr:hypothetical protein [Flavobacteriales bacterium]